MAMNLSDLTSALNVQSEAGGVSFASKGLKFNNSDDVKCVVDAINNCPELTYLNLEGNTLGVEAAEELSKALEKRSEFKRALWKDMFTGRMKEEIPKALESLGNGLVTAGARLTELDLSDNAFGPIGVKGLAALLKSSSCYALEELRLNNNGLGIGGATLLSGALLDCYNSSKKEGKPLRLRVFIAGRNRLENEGAKMLANVFQKIGTLEEIAMPQNGIYHVGITALSEAFKSNPNLKVLNLNDNTIGPKGAKAISLVLPTLKQIKQINFGDCLLKTKGAIELAEGLKDCATLEQLFLAFNEIKLEGGVELIKSLKNCNLKELQLDGNQFGEDGVDMIKKELQNIGKLSCLGSMDEIDDPDEDEDEEKETSEESEEGECSETENTEEEQENKAEFDKTIEEVNLPIIPCTIDDFVKSPSIDTFLGLGNNRESAILAFAMKNIDINLEEFVGILMKTSSLCTTTKENVSEDSLKCSDILYKQLFVWANRNNQLSLVNNTLLVYLGLIKSENKKFSRNWNTDGCFKALTTIIKQNYIPESTQQSLKLFMTLKSNKNPEELTTHKKSLLTILQ